MACKEVMVTAPLIVLLYDRTFLAGSFAEAWRRRWGLYAGLVATWGLLAYLVLSTGLIGRQPEMGAPDPWSYARTQPGVILHYLRLSFWPRPLCFDYAWPVADTLGRILPAVIAVGALVAVTVWGLKCRKAWGFLGAWLLLILAPTSSILPLGQLAFEHRMYLPLAAIVVLVVAGGYALCDRLLPRPAGQGDKQGGQSPFSPDAVVSEIGLSAANKGTVPVRAAALRWAAPAVGLAALVLALGCATVLRNADYRSSLAIYQDTVDKRPNNPVALNNLAYALVRVGRNVEAIERCDRALQLRPAYAPAHYNLGLALAATGRIAEAIEHYREAIRLKADYPEAHANLALVLAAVGQTNQAIEHGREAVRQRPDFASAHTNLGLLLASVGRTGEAIEHYREALQLKPAEAATHNNLGAALAGLGRWSEAIEHYHEALRLKPEYTDAHNNLGVALAALGRTDEAIAQYREALRSNPDYDKAHINLGIALAAAGKVEEAIGHYRQALLLNPLSVEGHNNLGLALAAVGRSEEAMEHYCQALRLDPRYLTARCNLARTLASVGRTRESVEQYDQVLQQMPHFGPTLHELAWLLATREPDQGGDPARAVQLAEQARDLGGQQSAQRLDTLAAAYAAAGRFAEAVTVAQQALRLAESAGQSALAERVRNRLELYRAGRPYRGRN